ncbi:3-hydroxybutyryl-CoA dehydratase [Aureimonas sp. SA4125]|uniref:enoyl-CoA hydratase/isomerase family protein n=1 Tax=Aureimonas sp. SA4125 TaxID=2826993 RepID=UPI001CC51566|nr:enoyl-CoA hydratase-related protein [Aureimonas sp. SA4125]BDA86493.1 3-hydroxybutyryl-CoA dehydratase [Aureimonas sp. SA4125]
MTDRTGATAGMVSLRIDGAVAELGLDAGRLNLVTRALLRDLDAAIAALTGNPSIRCVILHGGPAVFCAGSDIREFSSLGANASEDKILYEDHVLRKLAALPCPTIAAIDGPALGGGFELALACDLRVLAQSGSVGLPESRLGGLAASGAVRLARLVGPARAKEMLFTGMILDSERALAWGLVNRVTAGGALEEARGLAVEIAQRGPLSNRLAKTLVDMALDLPVDAALSRGNAAQQMIFDGKDLKEGAAAFFAKREPVFGPGTAD